MKLSELLDQEVTKLSEDFRKFNFEDLNHYLAWGSQHYLLIRHTCRMLHLCVGNVNIADNELYKEFVHHLAEEQNHELIMEKDLKRFNYDVTLDEPCPAIISTVDLQKYYTNNFGPLSFLGYGLLLEGVAYTAGKEVADRIAKSHGRRSAFLDLHVQSDDKHYPDGLARIDTFISSEVEREAFIRNLKTSSYSYTSLLLHATAIASTSKLKKSA